tara:strand:+ start:2416 stop:3093 length:678 start_codon:yes stop_codon:yes gene_type:complete
MGFFSKVFKGIRKVIKKVGEGIKKVVESKPFKVIATVAAAIYAPQLLATIGKGMSTAGSWAASTIAKGATAAYNAIPTFIKNSNIFRSITDTLFSGVEFMQKEWEAGKLIEEISPDKLGKARKAGDTIEMVKKAEEAKESPLGKIYEFGKDLLSQSEEEQQENIRRQNEMNSLLTPVAKVEPLEKTSSLMYNNMQDLMSFGSNVNSSYLTYSQGQELFGMPKGNV